MNIIGPILFGLYHGFSMGVGLLEPPAFDFVQHEDEMAVDAVGT